MYLSWNFPKTSPSISDNKAKGKKKKRIYGRFLTPYCNILYPSTNSSLDKRNDIYGSLLLCMLYISIFVFLSLKLSQPYLGTTIRFSLSFPDIYSLPPHHHK